MGLASSQDLPNEKHEETKWTFKKLLSLGSISNAITKQFISIFDVLLFIGAASISISEMLGRQTSLNFFILVGLILLASTKERGILKRKAKYGKRKPKTNK